MESRPFDLAAEFCELTGKANLLEYLGLPESASPDVLQKKLKARRKYMQGMQSNPKYRAEALFLIKNFKALERVLQQPVPYLADARQRAESQHLPVLEMTIKGALAGGRLSYEQEDYLRRNAHELGVSETTFVDVLRRLCAEAGVERATDGIRIDEDALRSTDLYRVLGEPRHATQDELAAAYQRKVEECRALPDAASREAARTQVELAWKVLADEHSRARYDLSWMRTGPPARTREVTRPISSATAPPVQRVYGPPPEAPDPSVVETAPVSMAPEPARLELLSQSDQRVELGDRPVVVSIELRNVGDLPLRGTVRASKPWLQVLTTQLDPSAKKQAVQIQLDPATVPRSAAEGVVEIHVESGHTEQIRFVATHQSPDLRTPLTIGAAALVVAAVAGVAAWVLLAPPVTYTIHVDPWAETILLEGRPIGSGNHVVIDEVSAAEATLTVSHPNFRSWVKDVYLEPGGALEVSLRLDVPMDFKPGPTHQSGLLDPDIATQRMEPFRDGLDRCLASSAQPGDKVRIFVGPKGRTVGLDVDGSISTSPATLDCLRRQAAGPLFPALTSGDYATVVYTYPGPR